MWLCGETTPRARDDFFGDAVEQIDGPAKSVQKPVKRPRDQQRNALGAGEAEALGDEFAEHNLQNSEQPEGEHQRDGVRDRRSPRTRDC